MDGKWLNNTLYSLTLIPLDNRLMDMARKISKLKNHHWLKLDQVTSNKLVLIDPE